MNGEEIIFKILILGNMSVGKTSFIVRFCDEKFYEEQLSTTGIDLKNKCIERNNKKFILQIYDTAGEERYHSISKNYFKSSDGILLLYDISKEETFKAIKQWIKSIEEVLDLSEIRFVIVGNKCDIAEEKREVNDLMKEDLEKTLNTNIIEASAKENINVEKCFMMLIDKIYKNKYDEDLNLNKYQKKGTIKIKSSTHSKRKKLLRHCCKE